jgi:hypothetical protein
MKRMQKRPLTVRIDAPPGAAVWRLPRGLGWLGRWFTRKSAYEILFSLIIQSQPRHLA